MTISYNWLHDYLPEQIEPQRLSSILTSIGLEVESINSVGKQPGQLAGLIVGEVISCEKHPNADKLKVTQVSVGNGSPLQIVCGASNVAAGQKVIVATVGTTLHPLNNEPITIKKTKIRGTESEGMICAEDEIGIGQSHEGIMVLPGETKAGTEFTKIYTAEPDHIIEIGLTPNRMDAMSHLGVARDVCVYLTHHNDKETLPRLPDTSAFTYDTSSDGPVVVIDDISGCKRYSAILIKDITVTDSPLWLQQKLSSINIRPINNIVDITNFILHETGQPLHAFDHDQVTGNKIIVKRASAGETFITLDGKERKLTSADLMINNAKGPMCIAGIYGGMKSGVTAATKNVLIESAWFDPSSVRKSALHHGLRTEAASRFEKGTDISNTANTARRAAQLITEITGGKICGDVIDIYPAPLVKTEVALSLDYLQKLSGKIYPMSSVRTILQHLGFEILQEDTYGLKVAVPYHKSDISLPCDLVEEIMRIDGLDNIEIPETITIAPSVERRAKEYIAKEKVANMLSAAGFYEIFTNSITNDAYYDSNQLERSVRMINSLSSELNIMRPSMLESGLQAVAYNTHRKNLDIRMFEFGKTYGRSSEGAFNEMNHLCLYVSGKLNDQSWNAKPVVSDFYYLKGIIDNVFAILGLGPVDHGHLDHYALDQSSSITIKEKQVGVMGSVKLSALQKADIKQGPVWYAELQWDNVLEKAGNALVYKEISKYPHMERDLAMVVDNAVSYRDIKEAAISLSILQLKSIHLFDIFESEKLGKEKKSMAIRFIFEDPEKTMTDKEVDLIMEKLIELYKKKLLAEIRK